MADSEWERSRSWVAAERERFRAFGATLRHSLPPDRWALGDHEARYRFLTESFDLIVAEMAIQTRLVLAIAISPEGNDGRGYTEHQGVGVVTIPANDMQTGTAAQILGVIVHELRHAWHRDVITGRTSAPLGAGQVEQFRQSEEDDPFHSILEGDSSDVASFLVAGYLGRNPDEPEAGLAAEE